MDSEYVTKTTDPEQRAKISCVRDLVQLGREVNGRAYANAFHAELPEIAATLRRINDLLWELDFELTDLLVYEKREDGEDKAT